MLKMFYAHQDGIDIESMLNGMKKVRATLSMMTGKYEVAIEKAIEDDTVHQIGDANLAVFPYDWENYSECVALMEQAKNIGTISILILPKE